MLTPWSLLVGWRTALPHHVWMWHCNCGNCMQQLFGSRRLSAVMQQLAACGDSLGARLPYRSIRAIGGCAQMVGMLLDTAQPQYYNH